MNNLYTVEGEALQKSDRIPWPDYPRPRMVRNSFLNLNGWWDFAVTSDARPPLRYEEKIRVPFVPESLLSGLQKAVPDGSFLWYHRSITIHEKGRILLHIGAADQTCVIWVNGKRAPLVSGYSRNGYTHEGGYEPFTADITELLDGEKADLLLQVHDQLQGWKYPYGKQSLTRGGMWYTPCSGIWQTVWIEVVPMTYIQNVRTETLPEADGSWCVKITAEGVDEGQVLFEERTIALKAGEAEVSIQNPKLWSPETPHLYRFSVVSGEDQVESYFALRSLKIEKVNQVPRLMLNDHPYFFHGLLDQGYWPDGLFTPADPACIREEIRKIKELGFNMVRKHIKIEPEIFYYECDRQGLAVFQDMVQAGDYSFFRDTILPTVGLRNRSDRKLHPDAEMRENFIESMTAAVRQLKEHPSIVYWTIFNEGWGQFCGTEMYMQLKKEDSTRFIDTASGWFGGRRLKTDVESAHIYFGRLKMRRSPKPYVLSEFGGFACRILEHCFNPDQVYGYKKFDRMEDCEEAVIRLYREQILPMVKKGLCAAVYTQVSDVEDETNGFFTYDRRIQKIRTEAFSEISRQLMQACQ